MGTASSIAANHTENDTEDRTTFGDRIEITRTLPVENFGKDDAHKEDAVDPQSASNERIKDCRTSQRKTAPARASSSIRSLVSSLYHPRSEAERTRSENTAEAIDAAELKLQRVLQLKGNLEVENERLKREISSLRSNVSKWRNESTNARLDEKQALIRAENLEKELDRVRRQFKCYRDGKEKEIHNLVKKKHELENSLRHYSGNESARNELCPLPGKLIAPFDSDSNVENISLFKAPGSLENTENKIPDCNTVFPLLPQVMKSLTPLREKRCFKLFLSADKDAKRDANVFKKDYLPKLKQLCEKNGKFFVFVEPNNAEKCDSIQLTKCDMFIGMLGNAGNRQFLEEWKKSFQIVSEKGRPLIYCIKDAKNSLNGGTELTHFIDLVSGYNKTKVSFYSEVSKLAEENDEEIRNIINEHFEILDNNDARKHQSISDEELISDCESGYQQLDMLRLSSSSSISNAGFTKYYDQLNDYVSGAGPSPPLLVIGASGSGKTTLLAKWISSLLNIGENVVLYHFVEARTNSTHARRVIRRFASQLFGLVPCLCAMLHCDPVECEEYFPRLLETVPQQVNTTIVIVIDSIDKLQNATTCGCLSWLNDPLPATVRVVLSMTGEHQPAPWSSWPSVDVAPLTMEESCNVLVSRWRNPETKIDKDEAGGVLENLSEMAITSPLFVTMLSHELSRSSNLATSIKEYSLFKNVTELTMSVLKFLEEHQGNVVNQVLGYICCSRVGLTEAEIMDIVSLKSCDWLPIYNVLVVERPILIEMNGLLTVSHEKILDAILAHLSEEDILNCRNHLVEFYFEKLKANRVCFSVVDQLPWLLEDLEEKDKLRNFLSRTDVLQMFIQRSRYSELLGYWKFLNEDSSTFGNIYFEAIKKREGDTPCLEVALIYETLGRFLKAMEATRSLAMKCLERSLEMKELVVEPDDPLVGQSLHYLADLYVILGNLESAESSYKQTLAINERVLGKDHPLVAKELESLAYVKKKQNNEKSHSELLRKAARIRRKSHMPSCSWGVNLDISSIEVQSLGSGRTTPELASSLHNLGILFMVQKKYQDAETLFLKSLGMREALLGATHPAVAQSMESLASLYCTKKMYSEAIVYYEKSLTIKQQNLDPHDPNLMSTINRLAMAFRKDGKLDCSESMYRQVLTVLQNKHDDKDPVIATALHNLAVVNCEQKKLEEALQLFEQAAEIYEEALGSSHPKVAECLRNLAKVHLDMGNSLEASMHLRRSQMIQENDFTVTTISSQPSFGGVSSIMDDSTLDLTNR